MCLFLSLRSCFMIRADKEGDLKQLLDISELKQLQFSTGKELNFSKKYRISDTNGIKLKLCLQPCRHIIALKLLAVVISVIRMLWCGKREWRIAVAVAGAVAATKWKLQSTPKWNTQTSTALSSVSVCTHSFVERKSQKLFISWQWTPHQQIMLLTEKRIRTSCTHKLFVCTNIFPVHKIVNLFAVLWLDWQMLPQHTILSNTLAYTLTHTILWPRCHCLSLIWDVLLLLKYR